jgi:hypothetical protein
MKKEELRLIKNPNLPILSHLFHFKQNFKKKQTQTLFFTKTIVFLADFKKIMYAYCANLKMAQNHILYLILKQSFTNF